MAGQPQKKMGSTSHDTYLLKNRQPYVRSRLHHLEFEGERSNRCRQEAFYETDEIISDILKFYFNNKLSLKQSKFI